MISELIRLSFWYSIQKREFPSRMCRNIRGLSSIAQPEVGSVALRELLEARKQRLSSDDKDLLRFYLSVGQARNGRMVARFDCFLSSHFRILIELKGSLLLTGSASIQSTLSYMKANYKRNECS
jgi:hypothetical protein